MNRRNFVKTMSVASTVVAVGFSSDTMGCEGPDISVQRDSAFELIETAIKADFGEGFRLLSYTPKTSETFANIEHLQNYYVVSSNNLVEWQIVSSSLS